MQVFGITDRGCVRAENQDNFRVLLAEDGSWAVLVLCDGMGGAHGGQTASTIATETFLTEAKELLAGSDSLDLPALVRRAASMANLGVYERGITDPECSGMGTTLVAVVCRGEETAVANIGDSRCYWYRSGRIRQITRDHSLVRDMIERGVITEKEARTHPRKNIITRAVGLEETVKCDVFLPEMQEGDVLLLCSDGLSNMVQATEICDTITELSVGEECCAELLELALERGAPDNVTVVLLYR